MATDTLAVEFVSYQGRPSAEPVFSFDQRGGTLGRGATNTLILNDPEKSCSRIHGKISYREGRFHYTNLSETAGTELIDSGEWLDAGEERPLRDGDRLGVGEYVLRVRIPAISGFPANPFPAETAAASSLGTGHALDDVWTIGIVPAATHPTPPESDWPPFKPPAPPIFGGVAGPETDPWGGNSAINGQTLGPDQFPPPSPPVNPPVDEVAVDRRLPPTGINADRWVRQFLEGADLGALENLDESHIGVMMHNAGALLRAFLEETMRALKLRDESKAALDLSRTLVANNLMKAGHLTLDAELVDQRLQYLLLGDCPGFEDPVENVRQGFADLHGHRLASEAAWRTIIDAVLDQFDPARFEKAAEDTLVFQRKAKCWDAYVNAYPKTVRDIRDRLIAAEFAAAYEQHLRKLRSP